MARNNSRRRRFNPVMRHAEAHSKGSRTLCDTREQEYVERQMMAHTKQPSTMAELYNQLRAKGMDVVVMRLEYD